MKYAIPFYLLAVCWLSQSTLASFVSDLKPDVNCDAVLASGKADREKDPSIVSIKIKSNQVHFNYHNPWMLAAHILKG